MKSWKPAVSVCMMPTKNNQKQATKKQKRETQCLQWDVPTSLMAQMVKNLPTMQETQFQSLGQEGPLEEEMATNSSILAWIFPPTEEPSGLQSLGSQKSDILSI